MWTCWVGKGNCDGFSFASKEVTVVAQISMDDFTSTFSIQHKLGGHKKKGRSWAGHLKEWCCGLLSSGHQIYPQMHTPLQLQTWGVMFIGVVGSRPNLDGIWRQEVVCWFQAQLFSSFPFFVCFARFYQFFCVCFAQFWRNPFSFFVCLFFPLSRSNTKRTMKELVWTTSQLAVIFAGGHGGAILPKAERFKSMKWSRGWCGNWGIRDATQGRGIGVWNNNKPSFTTKQAHDVDHDTAVSEFDKAGNKAGQWITQRKVIVMVLWLPKSKLMLLFNMINLVPLTTLATSLWWMPVLVFVLVRPSQKLLESQLLFFSLTLTMLWQTQSHPQVSWQEVKDSRVTPFLMVIQVLSKSKLCMISMPWRPILPNKGAFLLTFFFFKTSTTLQTSFVVCLFLNSTFGRLKLKTKPLALPFRANKLIWRPEDVVFSLMLVLPLRLTLFFFFAKFYLFPVATKKEDLNEQQFQPLFECIFLCFFFFLEQPKQKTRRKMNCFSKQRVNGVKIQLCRWSQKTEKGKCLLFLYFVNRKKKNCTICGIFLLQEAVCNKTERNSKNIQSSKRKECIFPCICGWVKLTFPFVLTQKYPHISGSRSNLTFEEWTHDCDVRMKTVPKKQFKSKSSTCCTSQTNSVKRTILYSHKKILFQFVCNSQMSSPTKHKTLQLRCCTCLFSCDFWERFQLFVIAPGCAIFSSWHPQTSFSSRGICNSYKLSSSPRWTVFLSWTFIWLMLLQVCLNSTCFFDPFVAVTSWNRWRRRAKTWTCQEGRSVVPRNQKIGIGERRHSLRTDVSSFFWWFLFVCFFAQQTAGKEKKGDKETSFVFPVKCVCFFEGFVWRKQTSQKKLDHSQQWPKNRLFFALYHASFSKTILSLVEDECAKRVRRTTFHLWGRRVANLCHDIDNFQTLFHCDSFWAPNKQRMSLLVSRESIGLVESFEIQQLVKNVQTNQSTGEADLELSQVQSPNNSHAPHVTFIKLMRNIFNKSTKLRRNNWSIFVLHFHRWKGLQGLVSWSGLSSHMWSLLCLFLLITNSTDPTTTATNKKCVFWWCDVCPSGTAPVEFHTKHEAENAFCPSWMGLFKFTRVKIWVRWKQACFFSFQNRVVSQRTRLNQCQLFGCCCDELNETRCLLEESQKLKKLQKKGLYLWSKTVPSILLIWCWTKTKTQQNNNKIDWTTKKEQNKKGKKKKLKHQSFGLWRESETMTRSLLSRWCFAEFLAALCIIMLWRRGLCECLGKHGWYFQMSPHPSCFRKGHCDLYQCLPSLLCDCGLFELWQVFVVVFLFSLVRFFGLTFHSIVFVMFHVRIPWALQAAVDVMLLSSWSALCSLGSMLELEGHQQFDEVLSVFLLVTSKPDHKNRKYFHLFGEESPPNYQAQQMALPNIFPL